MLKIPYILNKIKKENMVIKIINFIKNIFKKDEDTIFELQIEKAKKVGTKKQFADKPNREILICKDCGEEFVLTEGEKEFYKVNSLPYPKRCQDCRKARKQQINNR